MALKGKDNAEKIWNYLRDAGLKANGAAGLMGNLYAESGLRANNLQNSYEKSLGMDDDTYTAAVDSGAYTNFIKDSAGYGLAQWTYWSRKEHLLAYCRQKARSIGDLEAQLEFLELELTTGYRGVYGVLVDANSSLRDCSNIVLFQFERPKDQSRAVQDKRAEYAKSFYNRFAAGSATAAATTQTTATSGGDTMAQTKSALATITVDFGTKKSNVRTQQVSKFTIHHMAGNMNADACAKMHRDGSRQASANYYIGTDGTICAGVAENRRAWTSSSEWNDQRAITVEVANNTGDPNWEISQAAYRSLIALGADICKRYGIEPKYDGTKNGTLTEHKMFSATACPGAYIHGMLASGKIAADIKAVMGGTATPAQPAQGGGSAPATTGGEAKATEAARGKNTAYAGKYRATADLHIRNGAGTDKKSLVIMPKGTTVQCYGYYSTNGSTVWLYIVATVGGVKYTGFSSKAYLQKI